MSEFAMLKYPRTPHLEGSRLQNGDEDLSQIPFSCIEGKRIVVEEKCDGANSAVSFAPDGTLLLQSRGHYLTGGHRERHFDLLKRWAQVHKSALHDVLGSRYILYGEWMFAKHTVFYDRLPHYFLEFDIFDRESGIYLDTPSRRALLNGLPVVSVPVLADAAFHDLSGLTDLIGQSSFIEQGHIARLREYCLRTGEHADQRCDETDPTTRMEGLYIKVERGGEVAERMKFVRASFLQCVVLSGSHWLTRPIIPNQLFCSIECLFEPKFPEVKRIDHE
jgi:hypothetical protein